MENTLILKKIGSLNVFFRNENCNKESNQQLELEKMIKFLTNEEFEDCDGGEYKRKLQHPELFKIVSRYQDTTVDKYICLCTENTCSFLVIVEYLPTKIYFALGSTCYTRFDEKKNVEVYHYCMAKKCKLCITPLVYKSGGNYPVNTNKKCDGYCKTCFKKIKEEAARIYLTVKYEDKDDAKSMGAKWDSNKKMWYAPSAIYDALIKKYY